MDDEDENYGDKIVETAIHKRARGEKSTNYARRKRAVTACRFCRLRKTKCDNERPICGYCRRHRARCVYEDEPYEGFNEREPSQYETNQEILGRLKELKVLLQSKRIGAEIVGDGIQQYSDQIKEWFTTDTGLDGSSTTMSATSHPAHEASSLEHQNYKVSFTACNATRCELILRWTVFSGIIQEPEKSIQSFLDFDYDEMTSLGLSVSPVENIASVKSPDEQSFVPLCRKFLSHVYPRNPILESEELITYAKEASEHGLKWDNRSCLVLLACALACYTKPWKPRHKAVQQAKEALQQYLTSVNQDNGTEEEIRASAEIYMLAAKKRIGLLGHSILDIQCFFFASIYEKYSLRPLSAWYYIQQASSRLQTHLSIRRRFTSAGISDEDPNWHHLEQRIFWSCFKAESELLPDLGRRSTGLDDYDYPDSFPSPPSSLTVSWDDGEGQNLDYPSRTEQERSWFFYLAEISLRRTIDQNVRLLYQHGEEHWIKNIDLLLSHHEESERQISLWYSHLPASVRFDDSCLPDNELSFYLQSRFLDWREQILRPFVYCALHLHPRSKFRGQIQGLAQKGIEVCKSIIIRNSYHNRHGGTWFVARRTFSSAMLIMATVIKGAELSPPPDWQDYIKLASAILERWGTEATDVRYMHTILHYVFQEGLQRTGMLLEEMV